MLYFEVKRDAAGSVVSAKMIDGEAARKKIECSGAKSGVESRWAWKTLLDAEAIAAAAGPEFVATDAGSNVAPRYDVILKPKVGDVVSKGFNGDYYPVGKIVSVSPTLKKVVAEYPDGGKCEFYRVRNTAGWRNGGTWWMVAGTKDERNPSF